jgi:hypothetical protein
MGFDVTLTAFPPQCELLERVRAGEINAEFLQFVGWYFFNRWPKTPLGLGSFVGGKLSPQLKET